MKKALILDTETTGLNFSKDELIEISLLLLEFNEHTGKINKILKTLTQRRQPKVLIDYKAYKVHKISYESLIGLYLNKDKIYKITKQADFIISHNKNFDYNFTIKELKQLKNKIWLCSLRDINWYSIGVKSKSLVNLAKYYNIPFKKNLFHSSLYDTYITMKILNQINPTNNKTHLYTLYKKFIHIMKKIIKKKE